MAANDPRKPVYGDPDVALRDFRQKHKPHLAFAELVGDDQKTMEYCPIYGQQWNVKSEPLPEKELQNYRRRKECEKERKEAAAKGVGKKKETKKRSSSTGDPPMFQPDAATVYAPATASPTLEPPTTESTMPSDGRMPSASPPQTVAQAYSSPPNLAPQTALDPHLPSGPTSSIPDYSYHPMHAPIDAPQEHTMWVSYSDTSQVAYTTTLGPGSGEETLGDTPPSALFNASMVHSGTAVLPAREGSITEYTMPSNLYAPSAYTRWVADQTSTTFSNSLPPDHNPLAAPGYTFPGLYHPSHSPSDELGQYAAGVPYSHIHVASQGSYTTTHMWSSDPDSTYVADNAYTNVQSAAPLYAEGGVGSPWTGPSPSPPGTWAESPGWDATPPLHHTAPQPNPGLTVAHNSVGGTEYLSAAYQGFSPADRHLPGSLLSNIVPALTPELVEYYLNTTQVDGGYVPQAHPPTMIDNRFGAIACHGTGEQDRQVVQEMAQATPPPQEGHYVVWSPPSAVAPHIDHERSYDIERATDDTYAYNQDVPVQYHPAAPLSTHDAYPPKQSSYSELSQALHYPTHTLMDECAPWSMEDFATSPWYIVPPEADAGFYAHSSSSGFCAGSAAPLPSAPTYAQGVIVNHTQSGMSTHIWSQSQYAVPEYPYNTHLPTSTVSSSKMVETSHSTHIDNQHSAIRYGHGATA